MALEGIAARSVRAATSLAERPGTTPTRRRGQGHEIREVRPWSEGDDLRHIDAAASARTGSPQVRSFHEDRERTLMLIADFRRPMLWGTQGRLRSVAAAEALALAGWRAVLDGGAVGVVALTDAGPEVQRPRPRHRGMALVARCLERAHEGALAHRGPVLPLALGLLTAARHVPRGAGVVLATGLDDAAPSPAEILGEVPRPASFSPNSSDAASTPDHPTDTAPATMAGPALRSALAALAARGPVRLILVEDAFETHPPPQALGYVGPRGPAHARFADLSALRQARAEALRLPGVQVQRLPSSGRTP